MRLSVIVSDLLTFLPAVFSFFLCKKSQISSSLKFVQVFLAINLPPFLLVDHGHFQYNCVMLGLTLACVILISKGGSNIWLGSISFVLALNFKQMGLYYALPIFFFILGKLFTGGKRDRSHGIFNSLSNLGITALIVIGTFVIIWLPWLTSTELAGSVLKAVFPFHRGLYHLKVGSVWCVTNFLFNWNVYILFLNLES